MNRTRLSQALLVAVIGSVALIGCKKKEEPAPVPPPAAVEPAPLPPPAAAPATVSSVTLGNAIDANNTIATPLTAFAAGDTIHASVATDGASPGSLTAKWTHVDSSQTVAEETKDVPAGPAVTDFHIAKPDGWPTGKYKVEVSLDGSVVNTSEFEVK
ncbi:hypothetical protein FQY83_04475 [Luteimonas marina]|uniref:Uncharacterized protein n=1 Tax=Luteimonas marina TaxID=488485 RepID=A0A5C5U9P6_9GAMM|nr:hypothetical protein [Luteimonas marina]TWT22292.1 hypothetical protein FQY83_04475 [Luteimonas marina]